MVRLRVFFLDAAELRVDEIFSTDNRSDISTGAFTNNGHGRRQVQRLGGEGT